MNTNLKGNNQGVAVENSQADAIRHQPVAIYSNNIADRNNTVVESILSKPPSQPLLGNQVNFNHSIAPKIQPSSVINIPRVNMNNPSLLLPKYIILLILNRNNYQRNVNSLSIDLASSLDVVEVTQISYHSFN